MHIKHFSKTVPHKVMATVQKKVFSDVVGCSFSDRFSTRVPASPVRPYCMPDTDIFIGIVGVLLSVDQALINNGTVNVV